jgi:hypothetical protein
MYSKEEDFSKALSVLEEEYGQVFESCPEYDFSFTDYYEQEFGKNLKKRIVVFEKDVSKEDLAAIREKTGEIEKELSLGGKRTVNIDPGYISSSELVLATKKFRQFKEDIGGGVYAHKVLEFKGDDVVMFKHTFADYKLDRNIEFFKKLIKELF